MMLQMRKPVNTRIGRRFDNEEERIHIYVYSKKWKRKETYRWRMENQGVEGVLVGGEEGTKKTITHNGYENREERKKERDGKGHRHRARDKFVLCIVKYSKFGSRNVGVLAILLRTSVCLFVGFPVYLLCL